MGSLKPGATYIYERDNDKVYAREIGETDRKLVGYDYKRVDPRTEDGQPLSERIKEDKLWGEIRRAAKSNEALQLALDRAILIYHMSKDHGQK